MAVTLLQSYRARSNTYLTQLLTQLAEVPTTLQRAMHYTVLGGGKRIRAALVYATGADLGASLNRLDNLAAAVELVHAYSLIHDDLPCMDDDALRHGQPTCHLAFSEATAVLAGDALQALAFATLANAHDAITPARRVEMVTVLAHASGAAGMVGGQVLDLAAEGQTLTLAQLEAIHQGKTGALIAASVQLGALATDKVDAARLQNLSNFARTLGLAFQVQDDILDITSSTQQLGKPQGADVRKRKATYPSLLGLAAARAKLGELHARALQQLAELPWDIINLRAITQCIMQRDA